MLKTRVITALVLLGVFLVLLFVLPAQLTALLFAAAAALAGWEWAGLLRAGAAARIAFGMLIGVSCLGLWLVPQSFPALWLLSGAFWLAVVPFWLARRWQPGVLGWLVGWIVLVPTWAALVDLHGRGPWLLFLALALAPAADIAAYFAGRAWGRHKLAPAISPGKTWEGVVGAVVGVSVYALAASPFLSQLQDVPLPMLLAFLLPLTGLSIVGDLFESLLKRQAGIKDSSQLLPGHGGILDRIDSQTSTLPLIALCLHWMAQ